MSPTRARWKARPPFGDANRLQSVVDDGRFCNTALTPAEVQALAGWG